jgi:hypothetical protein
LRVSLVTLLRNQQYTTIKEITMELFADIVMGVALRMMMAALFSYFFKLHIFIRGIPFLGPFAFVFFASPFPTTVLFGFYLVDFIATVTFLTKRVTGE